MREALSLLDSTAGTQNQTMQIEDLRPAEEVNPEPDQSSMTMPTQDRPPAAEDPQLRRKHLNSAVAFFGIGIAAAGVLALWSWRESVPLPPTRNRRQRRPRKAIPQRHSVAEGTTGGIATSLLTASLTAPFE